MNVRMFVIALAAAGVIATSLIMPVEAQNRPTVGSKAPEL